MSFLQRKKLGYFFISLQTYKLGADRFRQQDQWVSKHAENRSAIS